MTLTFIWLENKVTLALYLQLQAAIHTAFSILGGHTSATAFSLEYVPQLQLLFFLRLRVPKPGTSPE